MTDRTPPETSRPPVLLWLRRELRLADNAALAAAVASGHPVLPVFVLDEASPGIWAPGGASRWWLHHSLAALGAALGGRGAKLLLRRGRYEQVIPALADEVGAVAVHAGLPTEPWARASLREVHRRLGGRLRTHLTTLAFAPADIRTQADTPYGVYSPFARACLARVAETGGLPATPLAAPERILAAALPPGEALDEWGLLPGAPDWAGGLRAGWTPGEAGAAARLERFRRGALAGYADRRDLPGVAGTSMLSPHLAWGEVSAGQIWHACAGGEKFIAELLWREFAAHLLWHNPGLPETPLRPEFAAMPWRDDAAGLRAWQRGRTGIPIVDAGMRQLWQTGWMHNRVRMIVASFLVKHLMIPWQAGEAWFWDTLVDADLAQNAASWQWVAGCGADAAPYFRVFNPVLQGRKFDADGAYVRRYLPELARVEDRFVHAPWEAGGVAGYPAPIIELAAGRQRALDAFAQLKRVAA